MSLELPEFVCSSILIARVHIIYDLQLRRHDYLVRGGRPFRIDIYLQHPVYDFVARHRALFSEPADR